MSSYVLETISNLTFDELAEIWMAPSNLRLSRNDSASRLAVKINSFLQYLQSDDLTLPNNPDLMHPNLLARLYFLYLVLSPRVKDIDLFNHQVQQLMLQIFAKRCEINYSYLMDIELLKKFLQKDHFDSNFLEQETNVLKFEAMRFHYEKVLLMGRLNQYRIEYEKISILKAACSDYKKHLQDTSKKNDVGGLKLHALNELENTLSLGQNPKSSLALFEVCFKKNHNLFAMRRDTKTVRFLKIAASVLSCGLLIPWLWKKPHGVKFNTTINHTLLGKNNKKPALDMMQNNLIHLPFTRFQLR